MVPEPVLGQRTRINSMDDLARIPVHPGGHTSVRVDGPVALFREGGTDFGLSGSRVSGYPSESHRSDSSPNGSSDGRDGASISS